MKTVLIARPDGVWDAGRRTVLIDASLNPRSAVISNDAFLRHLAKWAASATKNPALKRGFCLYNALKR